MNYGYTFYDAATPSDEFLITAAGPLQTMLTGLLGLAFLLYKSHNFISAQSLRWTEWLPVFISLFWLREVFNFFHGLILYIFKGVFPVQNDEVQLAVFLGMRPWSISLLTALAGAGILAAVFFKYIPRSQRIPFLISGCVGGPLGFYLWFYVIGPLVVP